MKAHLIALSLSLISTSAQSHEMQEAFENQPCSVVLDLINNPNMGDMSLESVTDGIGKMSMAFGYLLGFEASAGGDLSGGSDTILARITGDCAETPDKPALSILNGY